MPTTQILTPPTAQQEPVSLLLLNAALRLDLDSALLAAYVAGSVPAGTDPALVAELDYLSMLNTAAREKCETYTGRYFAPQTLSLTYSLDEPCDLPAGATATAVSGFYTDLNELANASAYVEEYRKGISVNRELAWGVAVQQTYTVTATLGDTTNGGPALLVPALVKTAITELVGEWYRNRETTADARGLGELPVSYKVKLAPYVLAPLGNY